MSKLWDIGGRTKRRKNPMKDQELNKDHLLPVHMVSADHYILRDPGRLYHTKGKSDPSYIYSVGCVLIDHASGYMSINHQVAINATETIKSKLTFESEAQIQGVVIRNTTLIMGSSMPQSLWRIC